MSKFDLVTSLYGDLPFMNEGEARLIREIIESTGARDILEIGFHQGKSSAYIAAVLEDRGEGSLATFDLVSARKRDPGIETVLERTGLSHRVTVFYCRRSYTWDLQRLINATDRPRFDFCYFDGGHTWDSTGFGVCLVDMLLRPGGLILLDGMDWSIGRSPYYAEDPARTKRFDDDEIEVMPVRLVWDTILPHLGYDHLEEYPEHRWGLARKPM